MSAPAQNNQSGPNQQYASLYVGDLHPEVTETDLYENFSTIGQVASVRLCRDSATRKSLGYAYVNFNSTQDAERVLDTLNYSLIKGTPCRIMWSHRDPSSRRNPACNVFVKNLDKSVDNKTLHDTFSLFGTIASCKVSTDANGKSRGYGFVHYETEEEAKNAIAKVNGMQIGEKTVFVGAFQKRDDREKPDIVNFTNLYVKNLPDGTDEDKLLEMFKAHGEVTSHVLMHDKKDRPFAFVNYKEVDEAKAAIEALHGKDVRTEEEKAAKKDEDEEVPEGELPSYRMYVQRAQTKTERSQRLRDEFKASGKGGSDDRAKNVNLYVKNLDEACTDDELKEMFATFGTIASAKVMVDERQRCKGFGFVSFANQEEATKAVTEMHLKVVKGKPLYVGLAEKKDQRQARLAQRFKGGAMNGMNMMMGMGMGMGMGGKGAMRGPMMMPPYGMMPGMPGGMQGMMPGGMNPMMRGMMPGGMNPMMRPQGPGGMPGARPPMGGMPMAMGGQMRPGMPGMPTPQQQQMMMQQQQMMMAGKGAGPRPMMGQQRPQMPARMPGPDEPLTASMLAAAPAGMQKQMLGEKLFPRVQRYQPELAGKITGMMLEMDNSELLLLLESEQALKAKVDEAMRVLENLR
jgi:polyadenylate-binding protein